MLWGSKDECGTVPAFRKSAVQSGKCLLPCVECRLSGRDRALAQWEAREGTVGWGNPEVSKESWEVAWSLMDGKERRAEMEGSSS